MSKSEPVAGREIAFLGRPFYIDETVHRPRDSTEFITKAGHIAYINQLDRPVMAADIGVGCGVTAISCALECPKLTEIYGVDLYDEALSVAARNATRLQADSRVELLQGELFAPLMDREIDVVLVNLPFASTAKVDAVKLEQPTPSEPLSGIHGGETGFELYEEMFDQLKGYRYMDRILGIWVLCATEHVAFIHRRHEDQFSDFQLMAFKDKYKPQFSHFLFTKVTFEPGPELIQRS